MEGLGHSRWELGGLSWVFLNLNFMLVLWEMQHQTSGKAGQEGEVIFILFNFFALFFNLFY